MARHTITVLGAPWPSGASVGDVVELGDGVPAWAVGKCEPAADGAEASVAFERPPAEGEPPAKAKRTKA